MPVRPPKICITVNQPQPKTQRIQCVCGELFELPDTGTNTGNCPECSRPAFPTSQNSIVLQKTIIADVTAGNEEFDAFPVGPDDHLDHFTILELIGAGGMGAVFRARDESLQRFVALKVIRGGDQVDDRRQRLIEEARAQARVSHPNIVHIYYVGMHNNCPFFAMELVDGDSIGEVTQGKRLDFSEIIEIAQQTTEALRHSAKLGVIHGDVKPANILLQNDGVIKLSDFGLAARIDANAASRKQTGPAGTLNYMAPEIAAGHPADERSDMYSLGVMLYELTFGELPGTNSSTSLQEQLKERQLANLKMPKVWPKDRPEGWRAFLEKILQNNRDDRFESFDELRRELANWKSDNALPAGRFQRACSYLADLSLAGVFAALTGLLGALPQMLSDRDSDNSGGPLLWLVLAATIWIHIRWKKSPGKKLMQLRIADTFGLNPAVWKLVLKSVGTYLFFWIAAVITLTDRLLGVLFGSGLSDTSVYETGLGLTAAILFVINAGWLIFSRKGQSAVDYFLDVKVVMDTEKDIDGLA